MSHKKMDVIGGVEEQQRPETDDEYRLRVQRMRDREQWTGGQLVDEHPEHATVIEMDEKPRVYEWKQKGK